MTFESGLDPAHRAESTPGNRVVIVDSGMGNIAAVKNMLARVGARPKIVSDPTDDALRYPIVLPGVGAFDAGIAKLHDSGWFDPLSELPPSAHVFGICLGMQLLGLDSEESTTGSVGLGRVGAHFRRIHAPGLRVPHMGWNELELSDPADTVFAQQPGTPRFYFSHSFHAECEDSSDVIARTMYGESLVAGYRSGNTLGFQFHPEKSHRFGMALFKAWLASAC